MKVKDVTDRLHNMARIRFHERENGVVFHGINAGRPKTWDDREVVLLRVLGDDLVVEFE